MQTQNLKKEIQSQQKGNTQSGFHDKEMLMDALSSQKFITDSYNSCANECATPCVKADFMNILKEEHQLQHEVFMEMQKRGWYPTEPADQNKINQTRQQYAGQM